MKPTPIRKPLSDVEHGEIAATWSHLSGEERIVHLARSFHVLDHGANDIRSGMCPWDARKFHAWIQGAWSSSASRQAGLFVLSVWRGNHNDFVLRYKADPENPKLWPAKTVRFDIVHAMGLWDDRNRRAFLTWASAPWWP